MNAREGGAGRPGVEAAPKGRKPPLAFAPALTVAASLAGFLALWAFAAAAWPSRALPPPLAVWSVFVKELMSGELPWHLGITLARVAAAFVLAMLIGTVIGILLGMSRRANAFFDPWVVLFLNIPALVIIVLAYVWFGLNEAAAIGAVAVNKIPNVVVTMREGARALDQRYADMAFVYRFSALDRIPPRADAAAAALSRRRRALGPCHHLENRPGGGAAWPLQRRRLPDLSSFPDVRGRGDPRLHHGVRRRDARHRNCAGAAL